jgi:hypothetical protein
LRKDNHEDPEQWQGEHRHAIDFVVDRMGFDTGADGL